MAARLRERGHDVEAVLDRLDLAGHADPVVFAAACRERRAIVTDDVRDYRTLAAEVLRGGDAHFGLVLTSNRRWPRHRRETFSGLVAKLDELLAAEADVQALRNREVWP